MIEALGITEVGAFAKSFGNSFLLLVHTIPIYIKVQFTPLKNVCGSFIDLTDSFTRIDVLQYQL